jgi:hypothetical protein
VSAAPNLSQFFQSISKVARACEQYGVRVDPETSKLELCAGFGVLCIFKSGQNVLLVVDLLSFQGGRY